MECGKKNKKKDGLLNSNLAVHEINFHEHEWTFCHMAASLCTYHNWLWTFMLPCWIATFDKLNNFYSFLILVHFYRDFAQFGHVVSLGHYVMGSEEILKLEEYIKRKALRYTDLAWMYQQLPLRQWGAGNVYLLVLSSWKVNIAEKPIDVMRL